MQRLRFLLVPLLMVILTTVALAQSGGGLDLTWSAVAGGGGTSAGGSFTIQGAIGQHDVAGPSLRGAKFEMRSGFWAPPETSPATPSQTYLPVIMR